MSINEKYITLVSQIIKTYKQHIEKKKGDLLQSLSRFEESDFDFRLIRGLSLLLERRCVFQIKSRIDPLTARRIIFEEANKFPLVGSDDVKKKVLQKSAKRLSITIQELEESLWKDLDDELILKECQFPDPRELLKHYNLSLLQTLLFKAVDLNFSVNENFQYIFKQIKDLGLIYSIEKDHQSLNFKVDGPLSLFKLTDRYGVSLSKLLPSIVQAQDWWIKANIVDKRGDTPRLLQFTADNTQLSDKVPVKVSEKVRDRVFDSSIEEKFEREFKSLQIDWLIKRESEPLITGSHVMIPDFTFEKNGIKIYLEIIGFWTEEYLTRKIEKIKELNISNIILAVNEQLHCSKFAKMKKKVIYYKNKVPVKPVLNYLKTIEQKMIEDQVEKSKNATFNITNDIIDLHSLAQEHNISSEALKIILKSKPLDDYVLIGDLLLSQVLLTELKDKIDKLEEKTLSKISNFFEKKGIHQMLQILPLMGYKIIWEGLDLDKATAVKEASK